MKAGNGILFEIGRQFAVLSLLAFGGVNTVIPEMHREVVVLHHWMSDADFVALFALSQAAPGPNFMISTLVGWKAAGIPGAILATLAMCGPSCFLAYWVVKFWDRYRETRLRKAVSVGLAPVTVGLVAATFWLLARSTDTNIKLGLITVSTAIVVYFTRLNPLWALGFAGGLGFLGFI